MPSTSDVTALEQVRFELDSALEEADTNVPDITARLAKGESIQLARCPLGAVPYVIQAVADAGRLPVVITPTTAESDTCRRNLGALLPGGGPVLALPSPDASPYLEVAADRRTTMDRLSVLSHLSHGLPTRALVMPVASLMRKVPPREAMGTRSLMLKPGDPLQREAFAEQLLQAGYVKAPIAEDPGTFALRGELADVFPPRAAGPARIELDAFGGARDTIASIRRVDAETQRTLEPLEQLWLQPADGALRTPEAIRQAIRAVKGLCDIADYPSSKTRSLEEDIEQGRSFYGAEHYLPAYYGGLKSVFDYLPEDVLFVVVEGEMSEAAVRDQWQSAEADAAARKGEGLPTYSIEEHFLSPELLFERLKSAQLLFASRGAGAPGEASDASRSGFPSCSESLRLAGSDQQALQTALRRQRTENPEEAIVFLANRIEAWLSLGLRVVLSTRTQTQKTRLTTLLKPFSLPLREGGPGPSLTADAVYLWPSDLEQGFFLPTEALVVVSENEIFGTTQTRRRAGKQAPKDRTQAFLADLRELSVGDFVVHREHGIGCYLGIERKALGQSQLDRLQGRTALEVEVLVIEYASQDRLFLPVTRLAQLQKFSGKEGQAPKLDKLGGQTFAKTKSKVRKKVKQLAEELLKLYAERAARERPPLEAAGPEYEVFAAGFPFEETTDQRRAIQDVLSDLEEPRPMDRVVCGDVGFGKTEVALRAAFRTAMAGRQVAILCPTTVLAQQHYQTFRDRLADYPLNVKVLSRFVDKTKQVETVAGVKGGTVDVVVGTHRLLSKDVHFAKLGLLVVDEEQRFGVAHKERIKKLRSTVDVLTLSATPIPRTLQLAIGGLRDLSLITTAPTDRRAVRTFAARWNDHLLQEAIRRELGRGGQVFFVFNRIEGLHERAARLADLVPEARIGLAHGQLSATMLERVMTDFVSGNTDILCSTAIVESGLDIPRANTMIVDRADMFGLAQLYQLRGRVGRSRERAYCYLLTPPPNRMSDDARYRIEALERFTALGSGFHVASLDMEQRGAGDLLGAEQSGTVAQIGFDLFAHMLEDAVAELRGESKQDTLDPEMTFDAEWYLPDDYIEDVGLRLSMYKRFAEATSDEAVAELAEEMEDRFGRLPPPAERFVAGMSKKPMLRTLRVLGAEARAGKVTLHLRSDTPLDPAQVKQLVATQGTSWSLSADMRLSRRFEDDNDGKKDGIERLETVLEALKPMMLPSP